MDFMLSEAMMLMVIILATASKKCMPTMTTSFNFPTSVFSLLIS